MSKLWLILLWSVAAIVTIAAMMTTFQVLTLSGALRLWGALFAVVGVIGAVTARRGWWPVFVVINVVMIASVSLWIANEGGGGASPTNFGLVVVAAYLPVHAAVAIIVGGLCWIARR